MTDQSMGSAARGTGDPTHMVSEQVVTTVTPAMGSGLNLATMPIEDAVMQLMMLLDEDSQSDLRAMLTEMQAARAAKHKLRDLLGQVNREHIRVASSTAYAALVAEAQQAITDRLDALNELSEMTSSRLQMAMDRRSKALTTLSNIMKKLSDTDNSIVQNMK